MYRGTSTKVSTSTTHRYTRRLSTTGQSGTGHDLPPQTPVQRCTCHSHRLAQCGHPRSEGEAPVARRHDVLAPAVMDQPLRSPLPTNSACLRRIASIACSRAVSLPVAWIGVISMVRFCMPPFPSPSPRSRAAMPVCSPPGPGSVVLAACMIQGWNRFATIVISSCRGP